MLLGLFCYILSLKKKNLQKYYLIITHQSFIKLKMKTRNFTFLTYW